ncbi:MAG: tRNA lysidine(34) synthetase TilS [Verrucomicrobiota bacterium]
MDRFPFLLFTNLRTCLDLPVSELENQVEANIRRRKLFRPGESILVAVSGGLDSMVLLQLLFIFSSKTRWKISVAHFNHQLRGRSSDADEKLVRKTAAKLGLKFIVGRGDVKKFARQNGISLEMAARKLRHEFLARSAKKLRIQTVALAHHADDQVELFFLRLLRGSGTEGLGGMSWKSSSPFDASIRLVRPVLDQSKMALMEFVVKKRIQFREDASNALPNFQRNRIRHEIFPLLESLQPALRGNVLRTMEIAAGDAEFVSGAAREWLVGKNRPPFEHLPVAVQRVCLLQQMRTFGFPGDFELIERLRTDPNRLISVNAKDSVLRDSEGTIHPRTLLPNRVPELKSAIDLTRRVAIRLAGKDISWTFQNRKSGAFRAEARCEIFDADKVGSKIQLRYWKGGDRFQPIGMKAPVKLQNLFTNLKIPREERHGRIVATTEYGEIFWVEGLRISERFKLDKNSVRRLIWVWRCAGASVASAENPC